MELRSKGVRKGVTMVAIDTNMLAAAEQFGIDVFGGSRNMFGNVGFVVPEQVVAELGKLEMKNKKMHGTVAVARELLAREGGNVKVIPSGCGGADEALLGLSRKGFIIATNDKELRAKARKGGGKVLFIRKKSFLELE